MAIFQQPVSSASPWPIDELPPKGTYVAVCIDVRDEFGRERKSFGDPNVIEKRDETAFLFGFRDKHGKPYKIATRWMRISGSEKSALYQFLRAWLGQPFPFGRDYAARVEDGGMLGRKAIITIDHEQRRDGSGVFPTLVSISPAIDAAPAKKPAVQSQADPDPLPF